MDMLAEYSGYSMKLSQSAQKTATESTTQFSNSLETTNFKRTYIGEQFKNFIVLTLQLMGEKVQKEDFVFEFNKNLALDTASIRDNYIKEIEVGVATPKDMIADLRGIGNEEAERV
jgi:hypothetical protein